MTKGLGTVAWPGWHKMSPNTLLLTFPQDLRIQGPPQTHLTQLSLLPLAPKPQTPPTHWALAPAQSLHPLSHTMIPTVLKMCPVPPQPQPLFSTQHLHSVTCFCLQTVLQPSSSSTSAPPRASILVGMCFSSPWTHSHPWTTDQPSVSKHTSRLGSRGSEVPTP